MLLALIVVAAVAAISAVYFWKAKAKAKSELAAVCARLAEATRRLATMDARVSQVLDLDAELLRLRDQLQEDLKRMAEERRTLDESIEAVRAQYGEKRALLGQLAKEVAIFEDKLAFTEMGVYSPHFDYTDSEQFKAEIESVCEKQKAAVKDGTAAVCSTTWSVDGSKAKGKTMASRAIKLALRAFNGECDAAISNVRWNNAEAMVKRIERSYEQVNKLNESNAVTISPSYFNLRLKELRLTHEYREKLKAEKEERAELARVTREEQKLQRDLERAQDEEGRYQQLLVRAKADAAKASGAQLEAYNQRILLLEDDLAKAHAKAERAQAMAEMTRSGYVYIISNIGSFGPDVVKIGLTRRLDPDDRIRELGDASVPFLFDTHAIIYSDDAPALERSLHASFDAVRVNAQNYRKEFFRATIEQVESAVRRLAPDAPFFRDVEAQDYRETLARRKAALTQTEAASGLTALPEEI